MRQAFWLVVIAFAASALCGGFLSGRAAVPHFPAHGPAVPRSQASVIDPLHGIPVTDELAADDFATDEAVALEGPGGTARDDATLAIVLVDAGHSQVLEAPFLSLNVPVTIVIDPAAAAAAAIAKLARADGDAVYVQARAPLSARAALALRARFPRADGVAVRVEPDALPGPSTIRALRDTHLALLDEYGENAAVRKRAAAAGVPYAARSITVDDHAQATYVAYMLRQAVHLARGRRALVMARPFPGTLQAFRNLLARASREGVRFAGL
ncbi:MAG TPA: divergent polysaccharide deacetylase family protein, partial [Candidatus Baltobacteraceae bacterium]